jgi:hypothetical protein
MTMRSLVALSVVLAASAAMSNTPAFAQKESAEPAAKVAAIKIPSSQLRFYCLSNGDAFSIGAVTCLSRNQWGTCKWTDNGSNHSAPANRAYWVSSAAPSGQCR